MEIPNDWWVAQNDDDRWIHQQMLDHEREEYEERERINRKLARDWVQLELDLGDDNAIPAHPF
jgi:hypothetical protein